MNYYYWLGLFGFISLMSLNSFRPDKILDVSACDRDTKVHPFLCERKMDKAKALLSDITSAGIPQSKAQSIYNFWREHPDKSLDAILAIKGIGPKTLEKIKLYFF